MATSERRPAAAGQSEPAGRPTGRQEVIDAILRSAQHLFAAHGPAEVSLRSVAAHAGVNYGLVHHYIGSRDELLRLVYRRLSENAAANIASAPDFRTAIGAMNASPTGPEYVRMLAGTLLAGYDPRDFLGRSPAMTELVASSRRGLDDADGGPAPDDAEIFVCVAMVLLMGWRLFGEFFTVSLGVEDDRERLRATVERLIENLPDLLPIAGPEA